MTAAFRAGTRLPAEREDTVLPLVSARGLTKDFGGDGGLFGPAAANNASRQRPPGPAISDTPKLALRLL